MATSYPPKTPGVYVQEISTLPPSVAAVSTAIPAFIGPTAIADSINTPQRIDTLMEFEQRFGGAPDAQIEVSVGGDGSLSVTTDKSIPLLYYSLRLYFANGGGPCYVVSTGTDTAEPTLDPFQKALDALEAVDEVTLIVLPDATRLADVHPTVCASALAHCAKMGDRFAVLDLRQTATGDPIQDSRNDVTTFRDKLNSSYLNYGAIYTPYLRTSIALEYDDAAVTVRGVWTDLGGMRVRFEAPRLSADTTGTDSSAAGTGMKSPLVQVVGSETTGIDFKFDEDSTTLKLTITVQKESGATPSAIEEAWKSKTASPSMDTKGFSLSLVDGASSQAMKPMPKPRFLNVTLAEVRTSNTGLYNQIRTLMANRRVVLPPSGAMAGIYARVDRERGVWKAPANVAVSSVLDLDRTFTDEQQEGLNVDPVGGRSINAIRAFTGRGTLVWGARTLAGNDNEWRYVSVRRLFIMIEESAQKSTAFAVFEPNDATTWLKVKAMIESFLYGLWEQGALAGPKPEAAYFVNVGLGTTMTPQDILEGRMIVEIGIAAVRPAEFIILKFTHKLQEA